MALLEIKNLVKNYGDVEALKGINLSIEKGEVVVILGPSGCGKSTFLRCLNGLEEIKRGQILLQNAGELGKDIPWVKARQRIGMVFQSYELFAHLSVIDNILLGPLKVQKRDRAEAEKQADELLKRVGLYERKNAYPRELSGGQKQRVAIARALAISPKILLLDEPAAGMNPNETHELLLFVKKLNAEGLTVVVIEHDLKFIMNVCDHIMVLNYGQKLCEGNVQNAVTSPHFVCIACYTSPQGRNAYRKEADYADRNGKN